MGRKGLSLVELLVVIGIILVLSGLVFVIIQKAKGSASSTVCISQLAQLGKALHLYSEDHAGLLPPFWTAVGSRSILGMPPQEGKLKASLVTYAGSGEIFYCPDDRFKKQATIPDSEANSLHMSYQWGTEVTFDLNEHGAPHLMVNFADSVLPSMDRLMTDRYFVMDGKRNWLPHGGMQCTVFFDLRAKCFTDAQVYAHNRDVAEARKDTAGER